ncbi:MAG: hypothetical protein MUE53_08050 [Chitinophagales bacterium]|jgi:MraZ protein|nr:hypothetical protein [Chitinophagales bacterium]
MSGLSESIVKLDDKGRIRVPLALKQALHAKNLNKFVVNRGLNGCITLYPYDVWLKVKSKVDKLNPYKQENIKFLRFFYNGATELNLDTHDKINIPKQLLQHASIVKDIVITPLKDYYEMWDLQTYQDYINPEDLSSMEDLSERVMGGFDDLDFDYES